MKKRLIQMYLNIHGEEVDRCNAAWLETFTEDELEEFIVEAGQVGVMLSRSASEYHTNVLKAKLNNNNNKEG